MLGGSVIGANIAGRYMPRLVHYKRMALAGLASRIAALARLAALAPGLDFWSAEALAFALGLGLGPLFPTATVCVQNAVDPRDLGVATATLAFLRTFGSAFGVALLGAVVFAFGVVAATRRRSTRALAERAGAAFRAVFASQALALAISLACLRLDGGAAAARPPSREPRRRLKRHAASDHVLTAVGGQGRSGDEAGFVGGEEHHAARDLLGLAEPAHRNLRQDRLFQHVLGHGHHHFGRDIAGADRVDGDALVGVLLRQRLGEAEVAGLGRRNN